MPYRLTFLCIFLSSTVLAQTAALQAWDFNGLTGAEVSVTSTTDHSAMEPSLLIRGNGLQAASLSNAFQSSQWTTTASLSDAILHDDYLSFFLQPKAGYIYSLDQLVCSFRRSSTGPDHFQWFYKKNEESLQPIGTEIVYTGTATNGTLQTPINLKSYTDLHQVSADSQIEFRLYGYNATGSTGTFALGRLAGNDLELTGTILSSLPIHLSHVSLYAEGNYVRLKWYATSDDEKDVFYIERSLDGATFETIDSLIVQAGGHHYQWMHWTPLVGQSCFYRLRYKSDRGIYYYSAINRLCINGISTLRLYPNPASSMIRIEGMVFQQNDSILLFNAYGQLLQRFPVTMDQQWFQVPIQHLPKGRYYISIAKNTMLPFLKE